MPDIVREAIAARIAEIAERSAAAAGLEVVETQLLGGGAARVVRIYIDKAGGVSHADCELLSKDVGALLDAADVIPGEGYTLEVSSPGLERRLTKPGDFERFAGQMAKLVLREQVENRRRWEGRLAGFSAGIVSLEAADGKLVRIPLAQVEKANLKFEW